MKQEDFFTIIRFSVTTFTFGAFLFMFSIAVLPQILKGNFEALRHISWFVFALELCLTTAGFSLVLTNFSHRIVLNKWRGFLAGIGAILLLLIISIFTQGASLSLIIINSLITGMASSLILLIRNKKSMP